MSSWWRSVIYSRIAVPIWPVRRNVQRPTRCWRRWSRTIPSKRSFAPRTRPPTPSFAWSMASTQTMATIESKCGTPLQTRPLCVTFRPLVPWHSQSPPGLRRADAQADVGPSVHVVINLVFLPESSLLLGFGRMDRTFQPPLPRRPPPHFSTAVYTSGSKHPADGILWGMADEEPSIPSCRVTFG